MNLVLVLLFINLLADIPTGSSTVGKMPRLAYTRCYVRIPVSSWLCNRAGPQ